MNETFLSGIFVEGLIKALKQNNIPVSGVDRMVLNEQLSVRDLIALGEFLLLPQDELVLATILKGPLLVFPRRTFLILLTNVMVKIYGAHYFEKSPTNEALPPKTPAESSVACNVMGAGGEARLSVRAVK